MTATCSGCRLNKSKKDPDIGVITYSCADHGIHSQNTDACADFLPIQASEKIVRKEVIAKPEKKVVVNGDSDLLATAKPIIGYMVAIAVVLIIAIVSFPAMSGSMPITLVDSTNSIATAIPAIMILIMLLVAISAASRSVP